MDDIIQLLPDHVANQIAAGEVVQRPASIVKELLENAIDAGATSVQLIVKDAGKTLIQVVDDGLGMSVTDVRLAFERHATSKIRTTEDIFSIRTKGFRGEALASIAAVAQVEAKTKRAEDELGSQLMIEGGKVRNQDFTSTSKGTSISVKNLFYNVPARRSFLKSNQVELRHIQDEFIRVALAHESVVFKFFHNDSELYHLKKSNLKQRIVQILGKKSEEQLVSVEEETEIVKINGFVGKPEAAKKSRGEQFFFVNQRFIKSSYLHRAVINAFDNLLPKGYFPSYFLYLNLDPSKIDINIHPTKTEIKFEEDHAIFAVLRAAVKHALGQFSVVPSLDFEQDPDWSFLPSKPKSKNITPPQIKVDKSFNPFERFSNHSEKQATNELYKSLTTFEQENNFPSNILEDEDKVGLIDVFQLENKYLVANYNNFLYVIDQHRAHQTILYQQFKKTLSANTLSQQLLFPTVIDCSIQEFNELKNVSKTLVQFGFDIDFESEKIIIKAIPTDLESSHIIPIFNDFMAELVNEQNLNYENQLSKTLAKHAAIKKGESLQSEQVRNLAQQLFLLPEPNYSPFGKPVFVQIPAIDIDKKLN